MMGPKDFAPIDTRGLCQYLYDGLVGYQSHVDQRYDSIIDRIMFDNRCFNFDYKSVLFYIYCFHMALRREDMEHVDNHVQFTNRMYHHLNI